MRLSQPTAIVVTMLLTLLISSAGVAWIDATVPGAWPDLIGPQMPRDSESRVVRSLGTSSAMYRVGAARRWRPA